MSLTQRLALGILVGGHFVVTLAVIGSLLSHWPDGSLLSDMLARGAAGIPVGQVILLGFWQSRFSADLATRTIGVGFVGALLWMLLVLATQWYSELVVLAMLMLMSVTLAWCFFEVLRFWWPWQFEHLHADFDPGSGRRVHLRSIMIAIGLVCVVLGMLRALMSQAGDDLRSPQELGTLVIGMLGAAIALLINLLAVLPCIVLAMHALEVRTGENDLAVGLLFPVVYAFGLALVEVAIMHLALSWMYGREFYSETQEVLVGLFVLNAAQLVTVAGSIVVLRHIGFIRVRA